MSKIFDALRRAGGEISKVALDEVVGEGASPAADQPQEETSTGPDLPKRHQVVGPANREKEVPADTGFSFEDSDAETLPAGLQPESQDQDREGYPGVQPPPIPPDAGKSADLFHNSSALPTEKFSQFPGSADWRTEHTAGSHRQGPAVVVENGSTDRHSDRSEGSLVEPRPLGSGVRSNIIRLRAGLPLLPFGVEDAETAAEEYRRVRTTILQHLPTPRLMLVSSPATGDGKSVTALNVSAALALNQDPSVLLVDIDVRRPKIADLLGVPEAPGVTDVLAGSCSFENAVVRLEPFPNLYFLPAGKAENNRTEWLTSQRWKALCDEFRSHAAYTILDGPPVDAVAEYRLLEERSDGLLLVIRPDHTDRSLLYRTLESIPKKKLIGGVINSFRGSLFGKPSSYHSYYSSQEQK